MNNKEKSRLESSKKTLDSIYKYLNVGDMRSATKTAGALPSFFSSFQDILEDQKVKLVDTAKILIDAISQKNTESAKNLVFFLKNEINQILKSA